MEINNLSEFECVEILDQIFEEYPKLREDIAMEAKADILDEILADLQHIRRYEC